MYVDRIEVRLMRHYINTYINMYVHIGIILSSHMPIHIGVNTSIQLYENTTIRSLTL
jgi:hypothetical protein